MKPSICIVMPVYNGEKFLKKSLNSLLCQSYINFEIIISDNNSIDKTEVICKEYAKKDSRITYIRQNVNIGAANNFIYLFNNRKNTEYFMWAACDDSWSQNWLEVLVANFNEDDCGLFGRYIEGNSLISSCPETFFKNQFFKFFLAKDATGKCYYSYALFKSDLLAKSNIGLMTILVGGDQIYLLNLLQFGNLRFIDGCKFSYGVHSDSEACRQSKSYGEIKRIILSNFPFDYYVGAIRAVPSKYKLLILFLIPVKYFYEQFPRWVMVAKKIFQYLAVQ